MDNCLSVRRADRWQRIWEIINNNHYEKTNERTRKDKTPYWAHN